MKRCRAIVAELATGILRRADSPAQRYREGSEGAASRVFESEAEALTFKDEVLSRFKELEVTLRPEEASIGGRRFYIEGDKQVVEGFHAA